MSTSPKLAVFHGSPPQNWLIGLTAKPGSAWCTVSIGEIRQVHLGARTATTTPSWLHRSSQFASSIRLRARFALLKSELNWSIAFKPFTEARPARSRPSGAIDQAML
jgi:hypothetical protein